MNNFFLKAGDTIGVCAPSSYVEQSDIEAGAKILEKRGYDVFIHPQTYARHPTDHGQSAGTHQQKIDALHDLYRNLDIKLIWAAGGGNRAMHILDMLDYDLIRANPKPMVGFSDVTALLNTITAKTGIVNYHGPVFKNLSKYNELDHLLALLGGEDPRYPFWDATTINPGQARGKLFGGNLSLFQYLPETLPPNSFDDAIIFLEDCNEELSRIDRMMLHLRRIGVFEKASGIIFGHFSDLQDSARPFGFTIGDIIREHTDGLNIPIIMDAPFGHGEQLYSLPVGQIAQFEIHDTNITFKL